MVCVLSCRLCGYLCIFSDADYTIFVWRQQQPPSDTASTSTALEHVETPTLHLHDPLAPLPVPPAYLNAAYYLFQPSRAQHPSSSHSPSPRPRSSKSRKTKASKRGIPPEDDGIPAFKKEFEKFHGENGVRTVLGSIGPVSNGGCPLASPHTQSNFIILNLSPHAFEGGVPTCLHLA